jgi:hypothetical protein
VNSSTKSEAVWEDPRVTLASWAWKQEHHASGQQYIALRILMKEQNVDLIYYTIIEFLAQMSAL